MRILPKRQKVAVVEIFGTIRGRGQVSPAYERIFSSVRRDRSLRALVLDIDSPGGSVQASEYLYHAVARIAEEKPVVACIRGIGDLRRLLHKLRRAQDSRQPGRYRRLRGGHLDPARPRDASPTSGGERQRQ